MSQIGFHFERAKMEETAAKYERDGYAVHRELAIGDLRFDMVAEKGSEKIFFEFLYRPDSAAKAAQLTRYREVAKANGATDFKVILFDSPKEVEVEIEGLSEALADALQQEEAQSQVDDIGNGVSFEGVYVGDITFVRIDEDGIQVKGMAEVDVEVSMGPSCEGMSMSENFSFTYDIILDEKRDLSQVNEIIIDTSSFFGRDEEDDRDIEPDGNGGGGVDDEKGDF